MNPRFTFWSKCLTVACTAALFLGASTWAEEKKEDAKKEDAKKEDVKKEDVKKEDVKNEGDKKDAGLTGTWKSTFTTQDGQTRETLFKLKQDGEKLTGTVTGGSGRGGDGAAPQPVEITEGKVKGADVSFKVTRKFGEREFTTTYTAKLEGDTLKGKAESPGRDGGAPRTRDFEAKRVKDEDKKEGEKKEA